MPDQVSTALRLPRELHERLKEAAAERCIGTNLLATKAIEDFLDRLIPVAELVVQRGDKPT